MTLSEKLEQLAGKATKGPWRSKIWPSSGSPDTVCIKDAKGREIIGWAGFDGVPCTKEEIRANARLVAMLQANLPEILQALKAGETKSLGHDCIHPEIFHAMFACQIGEDCPFSSVAEAARKYGIPYESYRQFIAKQRKPEPFVLRALGFEKVTLYRALPQPPEIT